MALSLAQKLKIKEGMTIRVMNAPVDYEESLGELPKGVSIIDGGKGFNQVHWFVKNKAQMEKELSKVLALVKGDVICWIMYPKGSSKIQTDLTRDKGWEKLLQQDMQWLSMISLNEIWTGFAMREKTGTDAKKEAKPKERPVFDYVNPTTKEVRLPEDFAAALKKHKKQESFFNTLSFSNKKEYIEWIVTAKREETRANRVKESVEKLGKELKNPSAR